MSEISPYEAIDRVFETIRNTDASLNSRLLLLAEAVREASPEFHSGVETLIARLAKSGLGQQAPKVGEALAPFLLPDQNGRLTGLTDILCNGPAVVSFLRGHWCPYCRLTASAFAMVEEAIGPEHMVAITPETARHNVQMRESVPLAFRLLTDPDSGYALSLNLAFWVDDSFADLMRGGRAGSLSLPSGRLLAVADTSHFRGE